MIEHFRLIRDLYISNEMFDVLQKKSLWTSSQYPSRKTDACTFNTLVYNITLMREVAHLIFKWILSMSTVQGVPKDVLKPWSTKQNVGNIRLQPKTFVGL